MIQSKTINKDKKRLVTPMSLFCSNIIVGYYWGNYLLSFDVGLSVGTLKSEFVNIIVSLIVVIFCTSTLFKLMKRLIYITIGYFVKRAENANDDGAIIL